MSRFELDFRFLLDFFFVADSILQASADAEGARKQKMIELLKSHGGLSYGQNGSHFEPQPVPLPIPKKCDWEIEPVELDFSNATMIGKRKIAQ